MSRAVVAFCMLLIFSGTALLGAEQPNVLFIAIDDLNHWVGHLGRNSQTQTPCLDRLASQGVSFTRANCAAPVCNPSRAALMSGLRPSTTGVYDNGQNWSAVVGQELTLTTQFLNAGYNVFGAGKIYHGSVHREGEWTEYFKDAGVPLRRHASAADEGVAGIQFCPLDNTDAEMPDYRVVDYGLKQLQQQHEKPFFLAIGLVKPHMPFSVPKHYFDMFPLESIELPPHREDDLDDVPAAGRRMAKPDGDHAAILKSGRWKEAVQAYLATIAFCDAQVGRLLDGLDNSPYKNNTIVVLWSDHGWHLGEKSHWRKFALWEEATRTVFIWRVPGMTPAGQRCERPVDYMSIYPTLCELSGLPIPQHVEGKSIGSLLANPQAPWDRPALTTYHLGNHSLRTERYRYIRYADGSEELYDHDSDPYEWDNIASDPQHTVLKTELKEYLPKTNAPELPRQGEQPGKKAKQQAVQRSSQ